MQQAEDTSGDESDWESASDDDEDAAAAAVDADAPPQFTGEPSGAASGAADGANADESADSELPDASEWQEWDVRRSLFDNHVSASFDANLDYMFRNFGFYFPDAEYLKDPEGLLKYLVRCSSTKHVSICICCTSSGWRCSVLGVLPVAVNLMQPVRRPTAEATELQRYCRSAFFACAGCQAAVWPCAAGHTGR